MPARFHPSTYGTGATGTTRSPTTRVDLGPATVQAASNTSTKPEDATTLSVEVVWEAQWRINGGAWQGLGFFSLGDSVDYPVRQVQARLTRTSN